MKSSFTKKKDTSQLLTSETLPKTFALKEISLSLSMETINCSEDKFSNYLTLFFNRKMSGTCTQTSWGQLVK